MARELLPIYCDGELDAERATRLEALLAEDRELHDELQRWKALRLCAHRVVANTAVPADLESRVRVAIAGAQRGSQRNRVFRLAGFTALAAAVALLLWFSPLLRDQASTTIRGSAGFAPAVIEPAAFARVYRKCGLHPHNEFPLSEPRNDSARSQLADVLAFEPIVPNLQGAGYELTGCCTCLSKGDLHAAHVHYRSQGAEPRVVSVFSMNEHVHLHDGMRCCGSSGPMRCYETAHDEDVNVVKWCARGETVTIAGQIELHELETLASGVELALRLGLPPAIALARPGLALATLL